MNKVFFIISLLFTCIILPAKAQTKPLQDSIDAYLDLREPNKALKFIQANMSAKKRVFLNTQKARIFLKFKKNVDSVPSICLNNIGENNNNTNSSVQGYIAKNYEILGHYYYYKKDFVRSIQQLNFASNLYDNLGKHEESLYCKNTAGTIFYLNKDYKNALETFLSCEEYFYKNPIDTINLIDLKIDIGLVYHALNQYEKSNVEHKSALDLTTKSQNLQKGDIYNNLGLNYFELGKRDLSLSCYQKALVEYQAINHKNVSKVYNNLGLLYSFHFKNYEKALFYFNKSLEQKSKSPTISYANTKTNIASALIDKGNIEEAIPVLKEALSIYDAYDHVKGKLNVYNLLVSDYSLSKNYKEAFHYQKIITDLKDSINSFNTNQEIGSIISTYERKENEREVERKLKESEYQETFNNQSRIITFSVMLFFVGATIFFYYLYRQTKNKQKASLQLARKDKELSIVSSLVKGQESERNRIARELHDSLGNTLAILKNKAQILKAQDPDLLGLVKIAAEEVRTISHDLMPESLLRFGLFDALEDLKKLWEYNGKVVVDLNVPADINDYFSPEETQTVYRIIQEAIKNAIQHGKSNYMVIQFLIENKQRISIVIEDNGVGFDTSKPNNGIGLKNIENRVLFLQGFINIESTKNGTKLSISIPIEKNHHT